MTATSEEILAGLKTWVELGALRWLDLAFAQFAAEQCAQAQAVIPLAAALVSGHNGHGHVCLDLADLWARPQLQLPQLQEADPRPLRQLQAWLAGWGLEHWLEQLEASGLAQARWSPDWDSAGTSPLVLDGGQQRPLLYLRRYWGYEQRIRQGIEQRLQPLQLPQGQVRGLLDGLFADDTAQPRPNWQKIACALAARSGFAIITGGPGTGKTTTVVRLLALLQGLRLRNGQPLLQVRLVAPTGKAAARLNESIAGSVQGLALDGLLPGDQTQHWRNAIPTEVSTLHRLLGSRPGSRRFRHHPGNPLALDLVVVDEASMVDVEMMASLVAALPDQARLILLGDKDQLASVEAGSVLGDLCRQAERGRYWPATQDWIEQASGEQIGQSAAGPGLIDPQGPALLQATTMLRHSYRFDAHPGIGRLAERVNTGQARVAEIKTLCVEQAWQGPGKTGSLGYLQLDRHDEQRPDSTLLELVIQGYWPYLQRIGQMPQGTQPEDWDAWALQVFAAQRRFQLLTAVRAGAFGVEGMNRLIYQALRARLSQDRDQEPNPNGAEVERRWPVQAGLWYLGRPLLVTRNDYGLRLMNGDIGICLPRPGPQRQWQRLAAFPDGGGGVRWILPSRLQQVETVFAMTVHKSQGSEFEHSLLLLPDQPSPVLTKELLYTGITRASQRFTLACPSDPVLQQALSSRVSRGSGL